MNRENLRHALALAFLLPTWGSPSGAIQGPPQEQPLPDPLGSWVGWMYLEDGDVPVRLLVEEGAEGPSARVDLPAAGQLDTPFGFRLTSPGTAVLAYPSVDEPRIRLELSRATSDDHLAGPVEWLGVSGRFDLHRAEFAPQAFDPESTRELVGLWGPSPGLVVSRRFWGDPVLEEPATGAERTLFLQSNGTWVAGPALYVASPVERRFRVERDESGTPTALVEFGGEGERRFERQALIREPVSVEREGVALHGTLTLPDRPDPICAVIAGGSGWTDRSRVDDLAMRLAAFGISSIVYDKRGYGASGGAQVVPFATTAADLVAFADLARRHPALEEARVGYLGVSRGGWYGALAASLDRRCSFFVDVVGPAVTPAEQETRARLDRMTEAGASEADLALGGRYLEALWEFARSAKEGERFLQLRREVEESGWIGELLGPSDLDPDTWAWSRINADFDPIPALRSIAAPVLALYGGEDLAVAARISAPRMREALGSSTKVERRVVVIPGVNHSLRPVERDPGGKRRAFHRSPGFHPEAWSTVAEFLNGLP